jgi:hypothetical protein
VFHRALLAEAGDKLFGVQECYISVCKEKDSLEERLGSSTEEALTREQEVRLHPLLRSEE